MTDIIDRADSGEVTRIPGEQRTRIAGETTQRLNPNLPTSAFPVVIRRQIDTTAEIRMPETIAVVEPVRGGVVYAARPSDTWINTGEIPPFLSDAFSRGGLQDPPTGNPPPLPPPPPPGKQCECCAHESRPLGKPGKRRRRIDRLWKGVLIGAGAVAAVLVGLDLAALLVMGGLR